MEHVQALFAEQVSTISPELGITIRNLPYAQALAEAKSWSINPSLSRTLRKSKLIACNFCKKKGHKERDCRAKKATQSVSSAKPQTKPREVVINSVGGTGDGGYLLDTGADSHVSGNLDDLSCYIPEPTTVTVAGGDQVISPGHGRLVIPSLNGGSEHLPGAILLPGQKDRLLSLKQLEKAGYTLKWASQGPISIVRPDKSICVTLHRIGGRLVWQPRQARAMSMSSRDWHKILGHPGPEALSKALRQSGISGYKAPDRCDTCDRSKMTRKLGHGSIRTTTEFGKVLHTDLVGGKNSLLPAGASADVKGPSWYLLVVDEATAWKWAFTIDSKKALPQIIDNLLEHVFVQYGVRTATIHCDAGLEFVNDSVRSILSKRGIVLNVAAAKAPE